MGDGKLSRRAWLEIRRIQLNADIKETDERIAWCLKEADAARNRQSKKFVELRRVNEEIAKHGTN